MAVATKKKSKARVFYAVACPIHGNKTPKNTGNHKELVVNRPESRKCGLHAGCPACKAGA